MIEFFKFLLYTVTGLFSVVLGLGLLFGAGAGIVTLIYYYPWNIFLVIGVLFTPIFYSI